MSCGSPEPILPASRTIKEAGETVSATLKYFKEGKTIEEIAQLRNFTSGTIETHLATAIGHGLLNIEEIIPAEELHKIADLFPKELLGVKLTEVKNVAGESVSYGKLRMVLGWLMRSSPMV